MGTIVDYRLDGDVAAIVMDDGKVNVMSAAMQAEIHAALDRAAADRAVVVLAGREGVFSAGFDLAVLRDGGEPATAMIRGGFELAQRLLSFPLPVVVACTGHALAMGAFLLLAGDHRIGAAGAYRVVANEVAIGLTMPWTATEILRQRLTPAAFHRAAALAESFSPDEAVSAGFLDQVVAADSLHQAAHQVATRLAGLDLDAHAATKLRCRAAALRAVAAGIEADARELALR